MNTERTPADHRSVLQELMMEMPMAETKEALRWALDQTQEPAPPPGGWQSDLLPKPQDCIEMIGRLLALTHAAPPDRWNNDQLRELPHPGLIQMALQWALPILHRAAGLTPDPGASQRHTEWAPQGPGLTTEESMIVLELALEAAARQEVGGEAISPKPRFLRIALTWALRVLRERPTEDPKIDAPALAALAKREIRFWEEAAEVSGKVTGRAAMRAIRGFKGVLRYLGALPSS